MFSGLGWSASRLQLLSSCPEHNTHTHTQRRLSPVKPPSYRLCALKRMTAIFERLSGWWIPPLVPRCLIKNYLPHFTISWQFVALQTPPVEHRKKTNKTHRVTFTCVPVMTAQKNQRKSEEHQGNNLAHRENCSLAGNLMIIFV